jgi:hypothetical protein
MHLFNNVGLARKLMKRTIHFPDVLAQQMDEYLKDHPDETWSGLVQKGVWRVIHRKDPSRLLNLVGILDTAPPDLSTNEDQYH